MVGSDRTLALNVEMASSLASHGKARNRFVTHFNAFTRIAIISNLVPWVVLVVLGTHAILVIFAGHFRTRVGRPKTIKCHLRSGLEQRDGAAPFLSAVGFRRGQEHFPRAGVL